LYFAVMLLLDEIIQTLNEIFNGVMKKIPEHAAELKLFPKIFCLFRSKLLMCPM